MKFIKKNKILILVIILFILFLGAIIFVTTLLPSYNTSVYGNRLNGINDLKISTEVKDDIVATIKKEAWVGDANVSISGKIINIVIRVNATATKDVVKAAATNLLDKFTDDEKNFYDIQMFIGMVNDEKSDLFPIIGYKSAKSSALIWSNN